MAAPHSEKSSDRQLDADLEGGRGIGRQMTVTLTAEQFEKLYLQPGGNQAKGGLAKSVGNPTLIGLVGFLLCFTPTTWMFMNFQGSSSASLVVLVGPYLFVAGLLDLLAGIMEWIIGNSFPALVFTSFGGFYLAFGYILDPSKGLAQSFATGEYATLGGGANPLYNSGVGLYLVSWGVVTFCYLIASLRTNLTFVILFLTLDVGFFTLAAAYFKLVSGQVDTASTLIVATGGIFFVTCLCGYWIFMAILLATVGFPFTLPIGDLSNFMSSKKNTAVH